MKKYAQRLVVATAAVVLIAGLAGCGKTVGETIDDATITTQVKTALLNDPEVAGLQIDVDTFKGVVTLSGRVGSQDEANRAIALARRTGGVAEVKSALQVIPSS
jgi:hyperosmotically inducible protein